MDAEEMKAAIAEGLVDAVATIAETYVETSPDDVDVPAIRRFAERLRERIATDA